MKIMHVIDSLARGGAETLLVNVVKNLSQLEHHIVTLKNINEFKEQLDQYKNVSVSFLGSNKISSLPANVIKLRRLIARHKPDIVHSQLYWSSVTARLATPKSIPFFFTSQNLQAYSTFKKRWTIVLEKLTYKKRHTLISVSKVVEEEYKRIIGIKGKHYVLHNMADDIFFKGPKIYKKDSALKFITVGRLHSQKNQSYLLRAFQHIKDGSTLDIYGRGPLQDKLLSLKEELNSTNVNFKGLQNLEPLLPAYDVFIMSSMYEGFSLAVIEAMASGLPVFLPDIPVFREMGGDAAIYIDLDDDSSVKTELEKMNRKILNDLSQKSYARALIVGNKKNYIRSLLDIYGIDQATSLSI
jgi:glycosyltransferase involved in cell wall biosynthesis